MPERRVEANLLELQSALTHLITAISTNDPSAFVSFSKWCGEHDDEIVEISSKF
jgi:hypothetical protein